MLHAKMCDFFLTALINLTRRENPCECDLVTGAHLSGPNLKGKLMLGGGGR